MSDPYDSQTLGYYAQMADAYLSGRPDAPSRHLPAFLALLKPGASILDLGCDATKSETKNFWRIVVKRP